MVSGNFSYFQNFTVHYVHYVQSHSPLKTKKRTEARTCPVVIRGRYWGFASQLLAYFFPVPSTLCQSSRSFCGC